MAIERKFLGLAGGWAADAVDAAIVSVTGRGERMKVKELHHTHRPLDEALSGRILSASKDSQHSDRSLAELDRELATAFAEAGQAAIRASGVDRGQVVAVGSSGQTIARLPPQNGERPGSVLELAAPAVIAEMLRLPVVAGFAASDLAAGGWGGPLAAWPDWLIFRHKRLARVVLHLGGLASLTFVPAAAVPTDVVAFDVGPAGLVLDALSRRRFGQPFDRDGAIASRGKISKAMLNELLSHAYFRAAWPKLTTGRPWDDAYIQRLEILARKDGLAADSDLIATYTELIARSIAEAIGKLTERPHEVILAGGAAQNIHLAWRIRALLSPSSTYPVERYGFAARAYAAVCHAVLAAGRINGKTAHCPPACGAGRAAVLGAIWQP